jgi:hypothetical protein
VGTDELFVLVIDVMGHGLRASLLRTLAVTTLRNARRTGLALAEQLRHPVLHSQFGGEQFVSARLPCASTWPPGQPRWC